MNKINIKNKLDEGLNFKISPFKEVIKKTGPHKHDEYYELIFLKEGEGFHTIEADKFVVSAPEFYFLKPGQLHFWQFTAIPKGFVALFREDEFDAVTESEIIGLYRMLSGNRRIGFFPGTYPDHILNDIFSEFRLNGPLSKQIIHGLLRALFGKLLSLVEYEVQKPAVSLSQFDKFQQLLAKECPRLRKVNEFAGLLNMTPQNLNAVCRKQSGKSAGELIVNRLLLEAKRYILHTDNTVNEISELLSFSDPSNFVKFFKKAEGVTPVQFRGKYFQ